MSIIDWSSDVCSSDLPLPVYRDILGFEIFHNALVSALTAEATLLDTTARPRRIRYHASIESDHFRLQSLGNTQVTAQILRINVRGKAKGTGIGTLHHPFFGTAVLNSTDWPEDLYTAEIPLGLDTR